ncbi:helix-turn-helix transcriptional regulator [Bacillus changyiensis]|uniref:helix-turn-helix domain-containing protein n=1 Tax=Bacillus changyiensis TaxID=3004103 RepID=UPI002938DBA2|nr:helix-turn-helix transcriptional regulator [Bacillus changyiensis]
MSVCRNTLFPRYNGLRSEYRVREKIAALRKEKGLSQYELADKLGFSRGKLASYEQETHEPDYETLIKFPISLRFPA